MKKWQGKCKYTRSFYLLIFERNKSEIGFFKKKTKDDDKVAKQM